MRERELEIQAMEEVITVGERCPVWRAEIEQSFLACPVCTTKLRKACTKCHRPLEPAWQLCPYCETRVGAADEPVKLRPKRAPRTSRISEKPG